MDLCLRESVPGSVFIGLPVLPWDIESTDMELGRRSTDCQEKILKEVLESQPVCM